VAKRLRTTPGLTARDDFNCGVSEIAFGFPAFGSAFGFPAGEIAVLGRERLVGVFNRCTL
jgi:hypothetical protein